MNSPSDTEHQAPTPRTDEELNTVHGSIRDDFRGLLNLARQLERELHEAGDGDTWREACKRLEQELAALRPSTLTPKGEPLQSVITNCDSRRDHNYRQGADSFTITTKEYAVLRELALLPSHVAATKNEAWLVPRLIDLKASGGRVLADPTGAKAELIDGTVAWSAEIFCDSQKRGVIDKNGVTHFAKPLYAAPVSAIEQRWIPCSERLPKPYQTVLLDCGVTGFLVQNELWCRHGSESGVSYTPTHWMPIPLFPNVNVDGRAEEKP